jgi:hypothetical protein
LASALASALAPALAANALFAYPGYLGLGPSRTELPDNAADIELHEQEGGHCQGNDGKGHQYARR